MNEDSIGIDISKDRLDAHRLGDGARAAFGNDARGLAELVAWCGRGRITFEATGRYHKALELVLGRAGLPFTKVNPRQARRFAEALGIRAKTDAEDAVMLARMGRALELAPTPPLDESLRQLRELVQARRSLVRDRTALQNRMQDLSLPLLCRQATARLRRIAAELLVIEREIEARIAAVPELAGRATVLCSIPGLSRITAAVMLAELPELGGIGQAQAAKLAGLAPINRASGRWQGRASIRGGRAELRQALYMPALAAMRINPDLKAFGQRLREAGKPAKIAITAVMRKLVLLANTLLREGRTWTPRQA